MKKQLKNILSFCLFFAIASCDDFIDKAPIDQLSQNTFFTDEATTRTAVIGAYRSLTTSFGYGQAFLVVPEFAAGHMAHISSFPEYVEYQIFNVRIDNPWTLNIWTAFYATINATNNIIHFAPEIEGYDSNPAIQDLVKEAKFIRALAYFNIVRAWGDAPLILVPTNDATTSADLRVSRNSRDEIYDAIVADLMDATTLPEAVAGVQKGRASAWSAKALLAKVHLYRGEYSQAAGLAEEIIQAGPFRMLENFPEIWSTENTDEAIFELQYDQQTPNSFVQNANPGSRQEFFANSAARNIFDEADARRDFTVRLSEDNTGAIQHYVGKYRNFNPPDQNIPLIRLAEIHLIHAEARARADGSLSTSAVQSLETVRSRANLETDVAGWTLDNFVRLVQEEKRREMMYEFEVWFDLCRTGLASEALGVPSTQRFLFPVPQLELDLNPNLVQNEGY
jgi:hypothetical protein